MLFSSGRKVLDCSLPLDEFERRAVFFRDCIARCRSTNLERRAVFLREEGLLFVYFVAARRSKLVLREERPCLFNIAQLDVLFDFPPLDEFGTSCCFLKGKHSSICIVVIARRIWNVVLVIDFVCL